MPSSDLFNYSSDSIPGVLLWKVSKLWTRHLEAALKPFSIYATEFVILAYIVESSASGPVKASDIVRIVGIDRMTVSHTLRSLERKCLITREKVIGVRGYVVAPTAKTLEQAPQAIHAVSQAHEEFFGGLADGTDTYIRFMHTLINRGRPREERSINNI